MLSIVDEGKLLFPNFVGITTEIGNNIPTYQLSTYMNGKKEITRIIYYYQLESKEKPIFVIPYEMDST